MDELQQLRQDIDGIDRELLRLFEQRMEITKRVGEIKTSLSKPIYDRKREEEIMQKVSENSSPHLCSYCLAFFRTMMDLSKDYQNEK
ncbi:MAG: chorismate mutase [Oscillospiraceae bacterium]